MKTRTKKSKASKVQPRNPATNVLRCAGVRLRKSLNIVMAFLTLRNVRGIIVTTDGETRQTVPSFVLFDGGVADTPSRPVNQ